MSNTHERDLPHGIQNTQSDFSPTQTADSAENPQTESTFTPAPPSPSESPMDIDMPLPSDFALNNLEHISSLELTLCSNFTCCSMQLPDLHALVEHFEENHVVVFNVDGMRIYPENSGKRLAHFPPPPSLSHSPSSSCSSSAVSSPQTPTTPLFSMSGSDTTQKSKGSASPCPPAYTPFNMSAMPESVYGIGLFDLELGSDPYPIVSNPPLDAYTSSLELTHKSCASPPRSKSHDPMVLDSVDSISVPTFHDLPTASTTITSHDKEKDRERERQRDREKKGRTKADIVNATAVSAKNPVKPKARVTGGNGKRREKAYRCPTPGCTKSYLNPNGLKYHVEKGTCRFEDFTDLDTFTTENTRGTASTYTTNCPTSTPAPPLQSSLVTNTEEHATPRSNNVSRPVLSLTGVPMASLSIPTPPATPGSLSPAITCTPYRIPTSTTPTPAQSIRPLSATLC